MGIDPESRHSAVAFETDVSFRMTCLARGKVPPGLPGMKDRPHMFRERAVDMTGLALALIKQRMVRPNGRELDIAELPAMRIHRKVVPAEFTVTRFTESSRVMTPVAWPRVFAGLDGV